MVNFGDFDSTINGSLNFINNVLQNVISTNCEKNLQQSVNKKPHILKKKKKKTNIYRAKQQKLSLRGNREE